MARDDDGPISLAASAIERLSIGDEAKQALRAILAELAAQYQQSFVLMLETQRSQAYALERLQTTLQLHVEAVAPQIKGRLPVPIRLAGGGEQPDIASAFVVSDPIGMGFTMSQVQLARVLGLSQTTVSILVRAFKLNDDGDCAVIVRRGSGREIANYHARAIERFHERMENPPGGLDANQQSALLRARRQLNARLQDT